MEPDICQQGLIHIPLLSCYGQRDDQDRTE
jgi:hypothetical protein